MSQTVLYISASQVRELLVMDEVIDVMQDAFTQLSQEKVFVPLRMHLDVPEFSGVELVKPVYSPVTRLIGLKVISLFSENSMRGLPLSQALMLVFDAETGVPLAIMDGNYLTSVRTGAASGLATRLLANPESRVAVVFGAGPQAQTQIEALLAVRPLFQIHIIDPNPSKTEKLTEEIRRHSVVDIKGHITYTAEIIKEADIICTVTTSATPVFMDVDIKQGVHINAVGAFKPHTREIPSQTVRKSRLFVDQRRACLMEAGDIVIPLKEGVIEKSHIQAEIGEVASGQKKGRLSDTDITLFKSVGNAIQDLATAQLVLKRAREKGIGLELEL